MEAFAETTLLWYTLLLGVISAIILAAYLAAFLTPKVNSRILPAFITGVAYFGLECLWDTVNGNFAAVMILKTAAAFALIFAVTALLYKREILKLIFLLFSYNAVKCVCIVLLIHVRNSVNLYGKLSAMAALNPDVSIEELTFYIKLSLAAEHAVSVVFYALLLFSLIMLVSRSFTHKKHKLGTVEAVSLILPCLLVFIVMYGVRVFIESGGLLQSFWDSYGLLVSVCCVLLLFILIFTIGMVQKTIQLHVEEKDAAIMREQIKEIRNRDTGVYAEIRGMRHDMNNHLSNLRFLLKSGSAGNLKNTEEVSKYIAKINETMERFEMTFHTGNPVTDAVVHGQYLKARDNSVKFSSGFIYPELPGLDAYDVAVILQNALDNAAQACEKLPENERFIQIRSRMKNETFFLEISNSYMDDIIFDVLSGLPLTTKTNAEEHGLGVGNIKRSAQNHNGDINIRLCEIDGIKVFTLTVILHGVETAAKQF